MKKSILILLLLVAGVFNQSAMASGQDYSHVHKTIYKSIKFPMDLKSSIHSEKVKVHLIVNPDGKIEDLGVSSENALLQRHVWEQLQELVLAEGMVDKPTTFIFNINFKVL
jgi:hypothetical protein